MIGCDSGGSSSNGDPLSDEDAKEEIRTVDNNLSSDVSSLMDGEAATALKGLTQGVEIRQGDFTYRRPFWSILTDRLSGQGISFRTSTGTYSWNSEEKDWDVDEETGDDLVLNFPTSPDESGNNATLTRSAYTTTQVRIEGEDEEVPTSGSISVTVDDVGEIFSADLSDVSFYDDQIDETQVPQSFLLKVFTAPQFHTFQLDSPSEDQFNFEFDLEKGGEGGEKVLGLIANATLTNDFDNVSEISGIDELAGSIELGPDVVIDYTVNVDGAANLSDEPSVEDINNQFTASVFVGDRKAGDIEFAEVTQGERTGTLPVMVYPDGDEVPLQQAFGSTFSTLLGSDDGSFSTTAKSAARSVKDAVWQLFQ